MSYQIAQVGNDQGGAYPSAPLTGLELMSAQRFLAAVDNDPLIGRLVDVTSDYEHEAHEYVSIQVVMCR